MAKRENMRERIVRLNPKALYVINTMTSELKKKGIDISDAPILTEDMTPEEEEMEFTMFYMRQGLPVEEAEKRARQRCTLIREIEQQMK